MVDSAVAMPRDGVLPWELTDEERTTIKRFHQIVYDTVGYVYWMGRPILKYPVDLWMYQELLCETRPDVIIETGTAYGGLSCYLASMMEFYGGGKVISVDIVPLEEAPDRAQMEQIIYVTGDSVADKTVNEVRWLIESVAKERERPLNVMVILDSDHSGAHVRKELDVYADLVTPGQYLVVEDTNLGHEVMSDWGPGPLEAMDDFLSVDKRFTVDLRRERYLITYNKWLRRE